MTNEMEPHKEKQYIISWTAVPAAGDALRNANFMRWCRVRDITGSIYAFAMAAESVMRSVRSGRWPREAKRISSEKMNGSRAGS